MKKIDRTDIMFSYLNPTVHRKLETLFLIHFIPNVGLCLHIGDEDIKRLTPFHVMVIAVIVMYFILSWSCKQSTHYPVIIGYVMLISCMIASYFEYDSFIHIGIAVVTYIIYALSAYFKGIPDRESDNDEY